VRRSIPTFVAIVQSILFLVHLVVYVTWTFFWGTMEPSALFGLRVALALLSISFVAASLLGFLYFHFLVRIFYTLAALWLGMVTFLFLAACTCWVVYVVPGLFGMRLERRPLVIAFFGLALLTAIYGAVNASWTRVRRITVKLPGLPESWRGRTAALVSDWHLGHIRNRGFVRHILTMLARLRPDVLFITGDLFDGSAMDLDRLAEPWTTFSLPLGSYFVTGNHEQFSSPTKYLDTVKRCGIRALNNEKIILDGLQIVGVHYRDSMNAEKFQSILKQAALNHDVASILLVHTPDRLPIAEEAGFSLQLCGHTHRGQFLPFTLIVSRIYGQFAYGLKRFGSLTVYTSSGAGTWGPPFRVGTSPEIVLIRFE
jgi:predicted MPP superfamily phosphohydrolase